MHTLKIKQEGRLGKKVKNWRNTLKVGELPSCFFQFFFLNWSYGSSDESSKTLGKSLLFFFAKGTRQGVPKTWRIWVFISEKEYGEWYPLMCVWIHASPDLWMQISDGS